MLKHFLRLNLAVNFHLNGEVIINVSVVICCFSAVYVYLLFFIHLAVIWQIKDKYCHNNDVAPRRGGGGWLAPCQALSLWAYFHIIIKW